MTWILVGALFVWAIYLTVKVKKLERQVAFPPLVHLPKEDAAAHPVGTVTRTQHQRERSQQRQAIPLD